MTDPLWADMTDMDKIAALRRTLGISPAPTISPMPGCGVGGRTQPPVALVIEFGTHLPVPLQRRLLRCQLFSDHCR
jgi:hypothetical protein